MSKHPLEEGARDEFWKRMRFGAAATIAVSAGLYAVTRGFNKETDLTEFLNGVKTVLHTPLLSNSESGTTPTSGAVGEEEARAVLDTQLHFAMERGDMQRVQELVHEGDKLRNRTAFPPSVAERGDKQCVQELAYEGVKLRNRTAFPPSVGRAAPVSGLAHNAADAADPSSTTTTPSTGHPQEHAESGMITAKVTQPDKPRDQRNASLPPPQRLEALRNLQLGDLVEALDPVTHERVHATVHALAKNGLVQVRWHEPGCADNGQPYSAFGEVWAEEIVLKFRKPLCTSHVHVSTQAPTKEGTTSAKPSASRQLACVKALDGLQIHEKCFAVGKVIEDKWFQAKLVGIRSRSPVLQVEYLSTLDGDVNPLLLPSPRKDYAHMEHVRRVLPDGSPPPIPPISKPPQATCTGSGQATAHSPHATAGDVGKAGDDDPVVVDPDLMCVVCERPDDDSKLLVCDCKVGYHIYCLSPPLAKVPEGNWSCPKCKAANH